MTMWAIGLIILLALIIFTLVKRGKTPPPDWQAEAAKLQPGLDYLLARYAEGNHPDCAGLKTTAEAAVATALANPGETSVGLARKALSNFDWCLNRII